MKIGQNVTVIRQGIMSTGWVGVIVNLPDDRKAEVRFADRRRTLTFLRDSLSAIPMAKPNLKAKKKLTFIYDDLTNVRIIYKRNGGVESRLTRVTGHDETANTITCLNIAGNIAVDDIIFLADIGKKVEFVRPKEDGFPFWTFGDSVETTVMGWDRQLGLIQGVKGMFFRTEWLKETVNGFEWRDVPVPVEMPEGDGAIEAHFLKKVKEVLPTEKMETVGMSFGIFLYDAHKKPILLKSLGAACHYEMKTFRGDIPNVSKAKLMFGVQFITRHYHGADDDVKARQRKYMTWVMNDSPWSQHIITKDFDEALVSGVRIRLDIPSNALMCTFYALRYPTEYPHKIVDWERYVDLGMNGAGAFFTAETICMKQDTRGHHQLLDTTSMGLDSLKGFINNKLGPTCTALYTERMTYSMVSIHHGKEDYKGQTAVTCIRDLDIYGGVEKAGGVFDRKEVAVIDDVKLVNEINKLVE